MRRLRARRQTYEEETEPNLVPIMNMFMVLIPFLLMSASFFHIRAINTSVPVMGDNSKPGPQQNTDIKITALVELKTDGIQLSAISDALAENELEALRLTLSSSSSDDYPFSRLAAYFKDIKNRYPASDTIVIIPDGFVKYETIIHAMDVARNFGDEELFPNVVISGSVG